MCPGPSTFRAIPRSITDRTTGRGDDGVSVAVEDDNGDSKTVCFEWSGCRDLLFHTIAVFEGLVDWSASLDGAAGKLVSIANFGTADADLLECMEGLRDAGEVSLACLEAFESDTGIGPMNITGAARGEEGGGGASFTGTSDEPCEPFEPSLLFFRR